MQGERQSRHWIEFPSKRKSRSFFLLFFSLWKNEHEPVKLWCKHGHVVITTTNNNMLSGCGAHSALFTLTAKDRYSKNSCCFIDSPMGVTVWLQSALARKNGSNFQMENCSSNQPQAAGKKYFDEIYRSIHCNSQRNRSVLFSGERAQKKKRKPMSAFFHYFYVLASLVSLCHWASNMDEVVLIPFAAASNFEKN